MHIIWKIVRYKYIYYFAGVVLFFVFHRWNLFFDLLTLKDVLQTISLLTVFSVLYFLCSRLLLRNTEKAAVFTAISFSLFLFYDLLTTGVAVIKKTGLPAGAQMTLMILLTVFFFIILLNKRRKDKLSRFYTVLLLSFILVEAGTLLFHFFQPKKVQQSLFPVPAMKQSAKLPSVYLVILDEYAGAVSLQKNLNYDNTAFLSGLDSLGFDVVNKSFSNYKYTILSTASMFNAKYLDLSVKKPAYSNENFNIALREMYYNKVFVTFSQLGYTCNNYSPFFIKGYKTHYSNNFLPSGGWLILFPSIFDEIVELAPYHFARKFGRKKLLTTMFEKHLLVSRRTMDETLSASKTADQKPVFYYLHLMIPHPPYVKDSLGNTNISFLASKKISYEGKLQAYLQYLIYTNKITLDFLSQLKKNTNGEAVIMLMSDHGLRDLEPKDRDAPYNCLNAVYYPGSKKMEWYDQMTNVNQFRILFSNITGNKNAALRDSIIR